LRALSASCRRTRIDPINFTLKTLVQSMVFKSIEKGQANPIEARAVS
jgi:hypothetical protein